MAAYIDEPKEAKGTWKNITTKSDVFPHYDITIGGEKIDVYIQNNRIYIKDGMDETYIWMKQ